MSAATFTHTGWTGTMLCADKARNVTLVLLTNRVYPNETAQLDTVHAVRAAVASAVVAIVDGLGDVH
jgi:CubicO group peptidase (beta-lactamase class C family)